MPYLNIKNRATSTLKYAVSSSDTTWVVATGEGDKFPTTDFHVTCEDEIVKCTSRNGDVLTVVRAQEGTTASAHSAGKPVELRITAGVINAIIDEIEAHKVATTGVHGVGSNYIAGTSVSGLDLASHKTRHQSGGADAINLAGLPGEPSALTTHKDLSTGVHGVGSNYICQAPSSGHLVRSFTRGWTSGKRLRGAGANADPTEFDEVISIAYVIDGGGLAITTGDKGYLEIPFNCTINQWTVLADTTGSIVIDVLKSTYANFPTMSSMVGSGNKPTISNDRKGQATPSGWTTTSISAGEILRFNVDSISTITRVTLSLRAIKS